ncbi:dihydrodipicolinate synthase family protein, partial [Streptococcus pneumoniae]|uniref:dihydrodipicolinate synthase family protein n=1 Tax=Streptococcus pneumoniae TaxID=1313 RepID=UPI000AC24E42
MSDLKKYEGVIPAFYACYDEQGEVSPERTRALVQYFIDKGVQGLYATLRWLSLPAFWVWTIGLYPDWIDGENFRKIPIGALFL